MSLEAICRDYDNYLKNVCKILIFLFSFEKFPQAIF